MKAKKKTVYRAKFRTHPDLYVKVYWLKGMDYLITGTPYQDNATVGYPSFWHWLEMEYSTQFRRERVDD